ncbi:DNA polymerase III, delta prime subunit [Geoalkalibacter ferrihydriticus]|uniref:DNA polymerase III subunit delta' n=2 Tax=Geoalkalibacter ferrihydriticus TaxID=392333 RepID=A0A0C2HR58_9BACT|nr:DNA polymerase III subunit delta' [Geoalkalibacter ferrihydriticus]KIH77360.1 DNA polymerase III subunit delta' [Geoalkalibacter ferrihydriticus DSM 17813]SDM18192.1 DNA polymerase III, delta prime subunit [Geoalkalibacter ferrihydriticus]
MIFSQILGHERQKDILRRVLAADRLAHAYLFTGPEGVGKRLMALALVRAVFCPHQGCGNCIACRKVDHFNHPDLHLLEPDGNSIKIEQVRAIQREFSYRPLEAPKKVCLIEQAEKMVPAAGNALLKTLEEPSGEALFILLSAHPEQLLQTIRSRCQPLPFHRIPAELLKRDLVQRLEIDDAGAHLLAALSDGSFRKALGRDRELFLTGRRDFLKAVTALSPGSVLPLFDLARDLAEKKEQIPEHLEILEAFYRDVLLTLHGRPEEDLVNIDLLEKVRRCAGRETPASVLGKLEAVQTTRRYLSRNVNKQLAMDHLLLQLCA